VLVVVRVLESVKIEDEDEHDDEDDGPDRYSLAARAGPERQESYN
jgi:hypothetical protein